MVARSTFVQKVLGSRQLTAEGEWEGEEVTQVAQEAQVAQETEEEEGEEEEEEERPAEAAVTSKNTVSPKTDWRFSTWTNPTPACTNVRRW